MADQQGIRVGHAERDRAVETLREAAADGRLTLEELEGRVEGALAARTRGDLIPLVADLVSAGAVETILGAGLTVSQIQGPGWSWQDPLILTARWDEVVRAGPWEVPPFLEVNPVASNVKLNFVDARVANEVIDIAVVGGAGDAVLVVPSGWGADTSRVEKNTLGTVKCEVDPRPQPGMPLLMVRGRTAMGNVKVRYPNRWDTWVRERRLAKGGGIYAKN